MIYGDGSQTRDFTFVSDAVRANLLAVAGVLAGLFMSVTFALLVLLALAQGLWIWQIESDPSMAALSIEATNAGVELDAGDGHAAHRQRSRRVYRARARR